MSVMCPRSGEISHGASSSWPLSSAACTVAKVLTPQTSGINVAHSHTTALFLLPTMDYRPEQIALRRNQHPDGRPLTSFERAQLVRKYLPAEGFSRSPSPSGRYRQETIQLGSNNRKSAGKKAYQSSSPSSSLQRFLRHPLHFLTYILIHTLLSLYLRLRQAYHAVLERVFTILRYHHRTPELIRNDVKALDKLPRHLSVVLNFEESRKGGMGLEKLVDDVAEIAAWCVCVGIPMLSVYEKTGKIRGPPDCRSACGGSRCVRCSQIIHPTTPSRSRPHPKFLLRPSQHTNVAHPLPTPPIFFPPTHTTALRLPSTQRQHAI